MISFGAWLTTFLLCTLLSGVAGYLFAKRRRLAILLLVAAVLVGEAATVAWLWAAL